MGNKKCDMGIAPGGDGPIMGINKCIVCLTANAIMETCLCCNSAVKSLMAEQGWHTGGFTPPIAQLPLNMAQIRARKAEKDRVSARWQKLHKIITDAEEPLINAAGYGITHMYRSGLGSAISASMAGFAAGFDIEEDYGHSTGYDYLRFWESHTDDLKRIVAECTNAKIASEQEFDAKYGINRKKAKDGEGDGNKSDSSFTGAAPLPA